MFKSADTLDDLMHDVFEELIKLPFGVKSTRSESKGLGNSSELIGVLLHLKNPRARLSRTETRGKPFSAIGEFLWYLSKDNNLDYISYYISKYKGESEDGKTVYGGYGPRLFNLHGEHDQIKNVTSLLREKHSTRKAVVQLFDGADISKKHPEIPCTCTLQFFMRENKLHMLTSMRSNDAFIGFPHDVFCFTMLQEILAKSLSVELGEYKHVVGSLHLYEANFEEAKQYLSLGYQTTDKDFAMPPMPDGDPWPMLELLSKEEIKIRSAPLKYQMDTGLTSYWADLARLLQVVAFFKSEDANEIKKIQKALVSPTYSLFIDLRLEEMSKKNKGAKSK